MSRQMIKHYKHTGYLRDPARGIVFAAGITVPTDASKGYAPGCIFLDIDAAAGSQWYVNRGTKASCNFDLFAGAIDLSTLTATAAELNKLDDTFAVLATLAGAGITGGAGTVYKTSVIDIGDIIFTRIMIDLTDLGSSTTDLDIIGVGASAAHIGQITAARNGTPQMIRMTCLEAPAGGVTDIDLYSAAEATGKFDDAVTGLTETALLTSGGAWANGTVKGATVMPAANEYLYLTGGAGGTAGTYTAGKFLIEIFGS